jgi:CRISPR-associated protein Csb1
MSLELPDSPRLLIEARLRPIQGTRFQPAGFPDIGAATYKLPDGTSMLLVESAQSVANHLESVCWDDATDDLCSALRGMPFVRVHKDGQPLTSSVLEAHRLNSAYIEKSDGFAAIVEEIGADGPFDRRRLARALLKLDPNSLIHGTFLESISGVQRLARALSGFVEARGVETVTSGGVKNDRVNAGKDEESGATAKDGFGNVPFHRDEYTAAELTAFFNLDLSQLRSYGLGAEPESFLFALSLWKVMRFLSQGLRLRTACDLDVIELKVTRPDGYVLPSMVELETSLPALIKAVAVRGAFAEPPVTVVNFLGAKATAKKSKGKKGTAKDEPEESDA